MFFGCDKDSGGSDDNGGNGGGGDNGGGGGGGSVTLDGTWVGVADSGLVGGMIFIISGTSFTEQVQGTPPVNYTRGDISYTSSQITSVVKEIWGSSLFSALGLGAQWYTEDEAVAAIQKEPTDYTDVAKAAFVTTTYTYTLSSDGKTLTLGSGSQSAGKMVRQ